MPVYMKSKEPSVDFWDNNCAKAQDQAKASVLRVAH